MERAEKLQFQQKIEEYFDEKKVYDLFEKLFKELIINKPADPIDFLIQRINKKDIKRIFITGYPGTERKDVSLAVSGALGYSCFNVEHNLEREVSKKLDNAREIEKNLYKNILVDDEIVIDLVRKQLIKYEQENVSYIIEGFPRNRVQAIFLQSVGLLPDSMIILSTTREKAEERVAKKLNEKGKNQGKERIIRELAKQSVDETVLNIRAVKEVFNGFYCEMQVEKYKSKAEVVDEVGRLLKFKNKTNAARRPPRIVLVGPPCARKYEIAEIIAAKLQIIHVSTSDLLNKEIEMKNDNSAQILTSMNQGDIVLDKFVLKLLEDRLFASDCMINGWILTGFPKNSSQINYLESMKSAIKPSLLAVIDLEEKTIRSRSQNRRIDPLTGKVYSIGLGDYQKESDTVKTRLVVKAGDQGGVLKKRIESWKKVSEELFQKNCLKLNGEESVENLVQLIEDAVGYTS